MVGSYDIVSEGEACAWHGRGELGQARRTRPWTRVRVRCEAKAHSGPRASRAVGPCARRREGRGGTGLCHEQAQAKTGCRERKRKPRLVLELG